jgi:hypothetical protein
MIGYLIATGIGLGWTVGFLLRSRRPSLRSRILAYSTTRRQPSLVDRLRWYTLA